MKNKKLRNIIQRRKKT